MTKIFVSYFPVVRFSYQDKHTSKLPPKGKDNQGQWEKSLVEMMGGVYQDKMRRNLRAPEDGCLFCRNSYCRIKGSCCLFSCCAADAVMTPSLSVPAKSTCRKTKHKNLLLWFLRIFPPPQRQLRVDHYIYTKLNKFKYIDSCEFI